MNSVPGNRPRWLDSASHAMSTTQGDAHFNWRRGILNIALLATLTSGFAVLLGIFLEHGFLIIALVLAVVYAATIGGLIAGLCASLGLLAVLLVARLAPEWLPPLPSERMALVAVNMLSVMVVVLLATAVEQRRQMVARARSVAAQLGRQAELIAEVQDGLGPDILVALLDRDGHLVELKENSLQPGGLDATQLVGRPLLELEWWRDAVQKNAVGAALQRAQGGEPSRFDVKAHLPDGTCWLDMTFSPLPDAEGNTHNVVVSAITINARKEAEERLRTVIESAPTALVMVDREGIIRFVNAPLEVLFGHDREKLLGKPLNVLLPEALRDEHHDLMRGFFRNPRQRMMGAERELYGMHADGHEVAIEIGLSPIRSGDDELVLAAVADVSERRAAQKALERFAADLEAKVSERTRQLKASNERWQRRNDELLQINAMLGMLPACRGDVEFCKVVAGSQERLFPGSSGAIYLADGRTMSLAAKWGSAPTPLRNFPFEQCMALRRSRLHLAHEGQTLRCGHHAGDTDADTECSAPSFCVPLETSGSALGLLHLRLPADGSYDSERLEEVALLLGGVSEQMALALSNLHLQERLRQQSIHDPLTGLYNRRYLDVVAEREFAHARRSERPLGVLVVDLDHFKSFNDRFGHDVGDAVLKQTGTVMRQTLRSSDLLCRYGGEEFVVLLPDADVDEATRSAERIRSSIEAMAPVEGVTVTTSVGVAVFPQCGDDLATLITAGDKALYRAKAEGRNRVCVASGARRGDPALKLV